MMLIEPGSPILGEEEDDVTLRLRLRELLDTPITDWPGQAQVDAARQLRGLIAALVPIAEVLEATATTLGGFPADDDGDDPATWAREVAELDRLAMEHDDRLRTVLQAFDKALAHSFEG